jgi:hypothetical protein
MPITINGTGTIAGISVGGLENGCVNEADLATAAVTNTKLASTAVTIDKLGTSEQSQLCKAWVNFNGIGTVAIRASFNVSSITDNGTGDYTMNFTNALADANYSALGSVIGTTGAAFEFNSFIGSSNIGLNAGSCRFATKRDDGVSLDCSVISVAVFR